jgi:hypothetical protein
LADEYGDEWVASTKSFIKQVSIEVVPGTSADEVNEPTINDVMKSLAEEEISEE